MVYTTYGKHYMCMQQIRETNIGWTFLVSLHTNYTSILSRAYYLLQGTTYIYYKAAKLRGSCEVQVLFREI